MSDILLDLFMEEAGTNLALLENGLIEGEQNGIAATDIETLMRAAHSLKGAARVIGLTPFVEIAHVCEDILVAAQNGTKVLETIDYDLLLGAVGELKKMAAQAGPGFENWFLMAKPGFNALLESLVRRSASKSVEPTHPAILPETEKPIFKPEGWLPTKGDVKKKIPSTKLQLDWSSLGDPADDPLIEFMKKEVGTFVNGLIAEISSLQSSPAPLKEMEEMTQQIRGSALLTGAVPIAELAQVMVEILKGTLQSPSRISQAKEWMIRATNLMGETVHSYGKGFGEWAKTQSETALQLRSEAEAYLEVLETAQQNPADENSGPGVSNSSSPARQEFVENGLPKIIETINDSPIKKDPQPPASRVSETTDRIVRVNAQSLERLMGLAGESLLEARWLQSFSQSLLRLKRQQNLLKDEIDEILGGFGQDMIDLDRIRDSLRGFRERLSRSGENLVERMGTFEEHAHHSDDLNSRLYREVILSRMTHFRNGVHGFPKMVREISRQLGKLARLEIRGLDTEVDRDILDKLDAPLTHLLRNSLDHGLETPEERERQGKHPTGTLVLHARHAAGFLLITLTDDGKGVALERIRKKIVENKLASNEMMHRMSDAELLEFLFLPGFSTAGKVTELSGRGVGLDVVHSTITSVGGSVRLTSVQGKGTSFHLQLPLTLSIIRAVLVNIGGDPYAFPHNRIDGLLRIPVRDLQSLQDMQFFVLNGRNVGLVMASQILQLDGESELPEEIPVVLFTSQGQSYALMVDEFIGEQDLAVRPLDTRLGKVPNVYASAILDDGSPVLILDVEDLRRGIDRLLDEGRLLRTDSHSAKPQRRRRKKVLVTDDSLTVREVQKQLLLSKGYDVRTAVDGIDGLHVAREENFDLIITDIDMPHMNGWDFVSKIRSDSRLKDIPVVVVSYKDREEDRLRGLEVGANYYLTKSSFQDDSLLRVVQEFIGEAIS